MNLKIYLETTIFNYYFLKDITRQIEIDATKKLFNEIKLNKLDGYVSAVAIGELENCSDIKLRKEMLNLISEYNLIIIKKEKYENFNLLANKYVKAKVIPAKKIDDAFHIAIATLAGIDILVSWNYAHIVRYKTQQIVHDINLAEGYNYLSINTPLEVVKDEK